MSNEINDLALTRSLGRVIITTTQASSEFNCIFNIEQILTLDEYMEFYLYKSSKEIRTLKGDSIRENGGHIIHERKQKTKRPAPYDGKRHVAVE